VPTGLECHPRALTCRFARRCRTPPTSRGRSGSVSTQSAPGGIRTPNLLIRNTRRPQISGSKVPPRDRGRWLTRGHDSRGWGLVGVSHVSAMPRYLGEYRALHGAVNLHQSDWYPRSALAARAASTYSASSGVSGTPSSSATTSWAYTWSTTPMCPRSHRGGRVGSRQRFAPCPAPRPRRHDRHGHRSSSAPVFHEVPDSRR
jgi:hypothetical protein